MHHKHSGNLFNDQCSLILMFGGNPITRESSSVFLNENSCNNMRFTANKTAAKICTCVPPFSLVFFISFRDRVLNLAMNIFDNEMEKRKNKRVFERGMLCVIWKNEIKKV